MLQHFVLGLATKHREMLKTFYIHFFIILGFLTQNLTCLVDFLIFEQTLNPGGLFHLF